MTKTDGGPAFPGEGVMVIRHPEGGDETCSTYFGGMTLREWYAGKVPQAEAECGRASASGPLRGAVARPGDGKSRGWHSFADAMIAEKEKRMTKTDWTVEEITVTPERDLVIRAEQEWGNGGGTTRTIRIPREQFESLTKAMLLRSPPIPEGSARPSIQLMLVLGIDPGVNGGMALVDYGKGELGLVDSGPLTYVDSAGGLGKKTLDCGQPSRSGDLRMIATIGMGGPGVEHVVIEAVQGRPGQNLAGSMAGAYNFGKLVAIVELVMRMTPYTAPANIWKRDLGLTSDKGQSVALANELFGFPSGRPEAWPRKKDEGIAEAALIAYWRARRLRTMERMKG